MNIENKTYLTAQFHKKKCNLIYYLKMTTKTNDRILYLSQTITTLLAHIHTNFV